MSEKSPLLISALPVLKRQYKTEPRPEGSGRRLWTVTPHIGHNSHTTARYDRYGLNAALNTSLMTSQNGTGSRCRSFVAEQHAVRHLNVREKQLDDVSSHHHPSRHPPGRFSLVVLVVAI
jgi:hypothetical protein